MLVFDIDGDIKAYTTAVDYRHLSFSGWVFPLTINNKGSGCNYLSSESFESGLQPATPSLTRNYL
jgi:hypothetical protein